MKLDLLNILEVVLSKWFIFLVFVILSYYIISLYPEPYRFELGLYYSPVIVFAAFLCDMWFE